MKRTRLLIYTKPPRIGLAKTRLAKGLGRTQARRIAHMTMAKTIRAARGSGCDVVLYTAPDSALTSNLGGIWPYDLARASQGPGDLTARLNRGLDEAPLGPVMFVGADAPDVSPALLSRAARMLARCDAVFGPADDGGFWLFGLHKRNRMVRPFEGVRWSGPNAMADVQHRLQHGARIGFLPTLRDIDDAADWRAWAGRQ